MAEGFGSREIFLFHSFRFENGHEGEPAARRSDVERGWMPAALESPADFGDWDMLAAYLLDFIGNQEILKSSESWFRQFTAEAQRSQRDACGIRVCLTDFTDLADVAQMGCLRHLA